MGSDAETFLQTLIETRTGFLEKSYGKKMNNSESLNYPKDKLKIVWVTDGSDDGTNKIVQQKLAKLKSIIETQLY